MKLFFCIFLYGSSSAAKLRLVRGMLQPFDCRISLQVIYILLFSLIFLLFITRFEVFKLLLQIEFVETLPKTVSGKIRRVELRENEWS